MPKVTLEYTLPEDSYEFEAALAGADAAIALHYIANDIFRPARKHGYSDQRIIDAVGACGKDNANNLIGLLESKFYEILGERGIEI